MKEIYETLLSGAIKEATTNAADKYLFNNPPELLDEKKQVRYAMRVFNLAMVVYNTRSIKWKKAIKIAQSMIDDCDPYGKDL